jgi:beta-lactamase regulating signal transducer with metallopeptidase domain
MNMLLETLNVWADHAFGFAWPMLWQSSLLIGVLFALDLVLRKKLRPAVRYALWLVVVVKVLLPPSLAFPTGPGWWLRPARQPGKASVLASPDFQSESRDQGSRGRAPSQQSGLGNTLEQPTLPSAVVPILMAPSRPRLSPAAWALIGMVTVSLGLFAWMLVRWYQVARDARRSAPAPACLGELLPEEQRPARIRLTDRPQSPAVCGLFRPVILLPRSLTEQLPPAQLRAVLLHELVHLRRGDVWVNCLQALVQILYWWHPLLWLANARIRRVREEAVDDAVMLALNEEADTYAPTLLEVAKLSLRRPLASLGLVGILESRSSLRERIERLLDFHPPRKAGLTLGSALTVLAFAAVAVPMGEAPAPAPGEAPHSAPSQAVTNGSVSDGLSGHGWQKIKASTLVHDGKLLYELGKLDAAVVKLKEALKQDPENQAALYYLNLVREARVNAPGDRPEMRLAPEPYARTNLLYAGQGRQAILTRLDHIRLDRVSFDGLPLGEVVRFLIDESKNWDPEERGVNFLILAAPDGAEDLSSLPITINPPLTNIRLADVLEAVVKGAGHPIKYSIEDYAVVVSARTGQEPPPLYVRTFKISENTLIHGLHLPMSPDGTNGSGAVWRALLDHLSKAGVDLDPHRNPGKAAFYSDRSGMLMVRATMQDLDTIEWKIAALGTQRDIRAVEQAWANPVSRELLPAPNPNARTNVVYTGQGRQAIITKLDRILLDRVSFDGLPLPAVVIFLNDECRKRDPEKRGINFLINQDIGSGGGANIPTSPALGPDGKPLPSAPQEQVDMSAVTIKINPALHDIRLADVLDAIVKVSDKPIKYSVEDYAVVFSLRTREATPLYVRTFKVDPDTLLEGLHLPKGPGEANALEAITRAMRDALARAGVDLDPTKSPGKALFYNERQGALVIRATMQDLDTIEVVIQMLNAPPDQDSGIPKTNQARQTTNAPESPALVRGRPVAAWVKEVEIGGFTESAASKALEDAGSRIMPQLGRLLLEDTSPAIQAKAAWTMSVIGYRNPDAAEVHSAVPVLTAAAQSKNSEVRIYSVQALGAIGPAASNAAPVLIQLTKDENNGVRISAVDALGRIGAASPELVAALTAATSDASSDVRITARRALAILRGGQASILTRDEARVLAERLANEKAQALYNCQPFRNGPQAQFVRDHWTWHRLQAQGEGDIEATVEFAADGAEPKVTVVRLESVPSMRIPEQP